METATVPTKLMQPGFLEPVADAQTVFRALLSALAEPALSVPVDIALPDLNVSPAALAAVLALADADTTVWLSPSLRPDLEKYLRFHTGAQVVDIPSNATFALVGDINELPSLAAFNTGTAISPETSTTLILQVADFESGVAAVLDGPGFEFSRSLAPSGFSEKHWCEIVANSQRFPAGIDMVLCSAEAIVGLPRSTQVQHLVVAQTPEASTESPDPVLTTTRTEGI